MSLHSPRARRARPLLAAVTTLALSALVLGNASAAVAVGDPAPASAPAAAASAEPTPAADRSSFLLPVIPDTQFYSRYSASQFYPQYGTNPFEVQTQWIVDHEKELNIPFAMQLGDVVDQQWVNDQWTAATKSMRILEDGGVPYSILPGNHDVKDQGVRSSEANSASYLANFGASTLQREAGQTLLGTFQNGFSSAYRFSAEGHDWIVLALGWNASDDTFAWAQGILDAHPGVPVILSSHAIIGIDQDQVSPAGWWYGDLLWEKLIRRNDQIVLTLNGHFHGATQRTLTNDFGHPVYQVLSDYQMSADGGNGIMSLFEFDLTNNRIDVETISPWVPKKHPDAITSTDTPVLDGTWQKFTLPLDFGARFGWAAPDAAHADNGDLSARATQIVSQGWTGQGAQQHLAPAGDATDYVRVDGTLAHWRFGGVAEGEVTASTEIPDIAGASPMYRNPVDDTDEPDTGDDVTITHTNVPVYSADKGAVCFSDVHRNPSARDNLAYLTTEYGAPATVAHLDASTGYTLETFLQMDSAWTEAANRWGAAITRGGARQWMGINDPSDAGAGAAWLGISNLREYQFSAADTRTKNSYTLWSGEIMPGSWHHVAIVNDPAASTVIMYVDGVPVLRNASQVGGMMAADFMPWVIGTSTWNTEPDHGWFGCVGETRLVDHALAPQQFLYQRRSIDAEGAGFALTTDVDAVGPTQVAVSSFEGTGVVGAAVRVIENGRTLGQTRVDDAGRWHVVLDTPVAGAGAHAVSFVQSIGSREGTPIAATVTITAAAATVTDPSDQRVLVGTTAALAVTVGGSPAPTVTWQSSSDGSTWTPIAGATSSTLTIADATLALDGLAYRAVASNGVGPDAVSRAATLTVVDATPREPGPGDGGRVDIADPVNGEGVVTLPAGSGHASQVLQVWAWSTPTDLGRVTTDPTGLASVDISALPPGDHTVALTLPGDPGVIAWGSFTVPVHPVSVTDTAELSTTVTASDLWSLDAQKSSVDFGAVPRGTTATARLGRVTVVDDRSALTGWTLTASTSAFSDGVNTVPPSVLAIRPAAFEGYEPIAGLTVGSDGGTIASSAAGVSTGIGGARFDAGLDFTAPKDAPVGVYRSTLTLTLVAK
ncbi:LamG-like jellyroll fold domain-containing protein [Microbacterium sp. VKM Ac-2923]|uniref:LamG-like jellyroll fold domain-containing protein n=1 Tax=Microbacterium sp. VKM Ac-2923 TaxID=2929476 RepID=UPI001FB32204|nr:LamG-like jellyroll fold domain-containing protein [Microbacterium sp. VKM Ac-2923]MCJ1706063.1 metallophosphoesterase [Microbacterium sp. VKM Ac-2923]